MTNFLRFFGAVLPVMFAALALRVHAQTSEERLRAVETDMARQDERYHAIIARLDSIDKTQFWLIFSTGAAGIVSGGVAADRAMFRKRISLR
jgi:hypothetical protein